jgi:hypothetical protein
VSLAPTLRLVVETLAEAPLPALCEDWERATAARELRALLAVARAAKDHRHADESYDEWDHCPICRALARLRKVSGTRKAGR